MLCFLLKSLILSYQYGISPLFGPSCRFVPTCSEYAKEALTHYGALHGGWLVLKRLCRCHPFSKRTGLDPLPLPPTPCCQQKDYL